MSNSEIWGVGGVMQGWFTWTMCLFCAVVLCLNPLGMAQQTTAATPPLPRLTYSAYFGSPTDKINALAVGRDGTLYLAGVSLPSPRWIDATAWSAGRGKPFVAHLSADGSKLLYFTHLSNGAGDEARAVAVDDAGNAYVTGQTREQSFPVRRALQSRCAVNRTGECSGDAFVAKLDPRGSLVFATYLGGSGEDAGNAIALDGEGSIYVAGSTSSIDFPTTNPVQEVQGGNQDAFVAKISGDGSHVVYATYLGGSGWDEARGIAVDETGDAYITGTTQSLDFPIHNALQSRCALTERGSCAGEAFIAKLSADGSAMLYSTYLGGSGGDSGAAIRVDAAGNAYVAGVTASLDFPLARPLQPALAGKSDAFVAEISSLGELTFSTYLGGSASDQARTLAIDRAGNLVVSGWTDSPDFPTADALQSVCRSTGSECGVDAFVSMLDVERGKLLFSSYLGGGGTDVGQAIGLDLRGAAYVGGWTSSKDFPRAHGVPAAGNGLTGPGGSFVAKIDGLQPSASGMSCGSGTNNWTGAAGDNKWTSTKNWSAGRVPISTDSVCISSSFSGNTITIAALASANQTISTLNTGAPISFSNGPLTVSGSATFVADVAISAGVFTLSGSSSMTTLELSGGTLSGAGTLSLSGLLTWSSGAICSVYSTSAQSCSATPTEAILNANGGISFGAGFPELDARTLNNAASAIMASGGSYLNLLDSAIVNNLSGATWNLTADASLNGSSGTFNNAGSFQKTSGTSTSTVQPTFNNAGTVLTNVAILDFTGGGICAATCPGSWSIAAAGALQFDSATFSLTGPFSGAGMVSFSSGFVSLSGGYTFTGTTNFSGGVVGFNQTGAVTFAGPVNLASGYVYGATTLTFNQPLTWTYGVMCTSYSQSAAACTVPLIQAVTNAKGGINFPIGYPTLNARTLNNPKSATMNGAGSFLNLLNNAVVNNQSGATWNLAADAGLSGATGIFNNAGTFQKTAGTAVSTIQPVFNNAGTVQANAATLDFTGGGICVLSCPGLWTIAQGATLQFDSGTFVLSGPIGSSTSGAGTIVFSSGTETLTGPYNITGKTTVSGAFVNFNGAMTNGGVLTVSAGLANLTNTPAVTLVVPALTLSGGVIVGTDSLTVTGPLNWSSGVMCTIYSVPTQTCVTSLPQAITTANGGLTLGTSQLLLVSRTLTNNQSATMASSASTLTMADNAIVNNNAGATWTLAADANLLGPYCTFNNFGTFKKTGGTSISAIQAAFVNNGTVQANAATISFAGGFQQKSGTTLLGGGAVSLSSTATFSGGALSGQGSFAGAVSNASATLAPGTSTTAGKISLTSSSGAYTQKASGAFKVKIGGTSAGQFDQLSAGGAVKLGGALNVSTINGFSPQHGNAFTIINGASIAGQFSSVTTGWKVTYNSASVVLTFK